MVWMRHHFMLTGVGDHLCGAQGADRYLTGITAMLYQEKTNTSHVFFYMYVKTFSFDVFFHIYVNKFSFDVLVFFTYM